MNRLIQQAEGFIHSRRTYLSVIGCLGLSFFLAPLLVRAKTQDAMKAIQEILGSTVAKEGRINLVIPSLVESGNLVVLQVSVLSPMTSVDYVKSVHIISEGNPLPNVFSAYFTPRSGSATVTTRVRLAESQRVWAIAQMSDDSFYQAYADTIVTLSACTESI